MSKRILVVDDDRKIQELQKVLFTRSGFEVVTADDGFQAIKTALEKTPDIIILDIEMPGKDGYATLVELRSHAELKEIPVIMLSGLTDQVYHQISGSLGTFMHMNKPFAPDKLLSTVKAILQTGE